MTKNNQAFFNAIETEILKNNNIEIKNKFNQKTTMPHSILFEVKSKKGSFRIINSISGYSLETNFDKFNKIYFNEFDDKILNLLTDIIKKRL